MKTHSQNFDLQEAYQVEMCILWFSRMKLLILILLSTVAVFFAWNLVFIISQLPLGLRKVDMCWLTWCIMLEKFLLQGRRVIQSPMQWCWNSIFTIPLNWKWPNVQARIIRCSTLLKVGYYHKLWSMIYHWTVIINDFWVLKSFFISL